MVGGLVVSEYTHITLRASHIDEKQSTLDDYSPLGMWLKENKVYGVL